MLKNKPTKLEDKILKDIKTGRLKLRSRYIFLAEKFGLGGALGFSFILLILFFSLLLFYLRSTDSLVYLSFGLGGLYSFLESLPYPLIFTLAALILITGYLLTKADFSYRQPFKYLALAFLGIVLIFSSILAFSRSTQELGNQIIIGNCHGSMRFLHSFLDQGLNRRRHARRGVIQSIKGNQAVIQTPHGLARLKFSAESVSQLSVDKFIVATGYLAGDEFIVSSFRLFDQPLPFLRGHYGRHACQP